MKKKNLKTSDIAHAKYSASGSSRWLSCPGSIKLSELAPVPPESKYALEGTEAHSCLEFLLRNRRNMKGATKIALKKYGEEMVNHCLKAVFYVLDRFEAFEDAELLIETKVDASYFTCPDQFGTLDVAIIAEFEKLIVIDFKYGAGVSVDPEGYDGKGNSQLAYYALGVSKLYHHNFNEVELVVIQPRAFHASGQTTRTYTMPIEDLLSWVPVFQDGVKRTNEKTPRYASGDWCKFCPAAVICPEIKNKALERARIEFSDTAGIIESPVPKMVTVKNLPTMLEACDQLEKWIEHLRAHAFGVLESGGKIEGYKLVDKRPTRKWKNTEKAEFGLYNLLGDKIYAPKKLLTPNQIENLSVKKKRKADVNELVRLYTVAESSGVTMVKDSDTRLPIDKVASVYTYIDVTNLGSKKGKTK